MANFGPGSPAYSSLVVNGQLLPVVTAQQSMPGQGVGPTFKGYGSTPPSTIPAPMGSGPSLAQSSGASLAATSQPFDLRKSPVLWLLGALVVSLLGLRYIHFRG